jgi:hypothetical protein
MLRLIEPLDRRQGLTEHAGNQMQVSTKVFERHNILLQA